MLLSGVEAMRVIGIKKVAKRLPRATVLGGVTKETGLGLFQKSRTWMGDRRKDQFRPGAYN